MPGRGISSLPERSGFRRSWLCGRIVCNEIGKRAAGVNADAERCNVRNGEDTHISAKCPDLIGRALIGNSFGFVFTGYY